MVEALITLYLRRSTVLLATLRCEISLFFVICFPYFITFFCFKVLIIFVCYLLLAQTTVIVLLLSITFEYFNRELVVLKSTKVFFDVKWLPYYRKREFGSVFIAKRGVVFVFQHDLLPQCFLRPIHKQTLLLEAINGWRKVVWKRERWTPRAVLLFTASQVLVYCLNFSFHTLDI